MYPYRIRLRGPWECEPDGQLARRVTMPCGWAEAGLSGFRGVVRFTRKFGYPGRIDDGEHVWLTCDGCVSCSELLLNGQRLAQGCPETFAFDITPILGPRNRLDIWIQGIDDDVAGLRGEVALEIRRDAYLAELQVCRSERGAYVTGVAIGTAPQALELYTLVDQRNADYRTIQPTPEGQAFRVELPEVTSANQMVRVDLIHISTIWYAVEMAIPP